MKKIGVLFLCIVLTCIGMVTAVTAQEITEPGESEGLAIQAFKPGIGDVNLDESVDVVDLVLIKRHVVGHTPISSAGLQAALVSEGEYISAADVVALKKMLLGIPLN